MPIDLAHDPTVVDLAERTARFVRDTVLPYELNNQGVIGSDRDRTWLQEQAKAVGVFAPHVGAEWGGHGLDIAGPACSKKQATGCSAHWP